MEKQMKTQQIDTQQVADKAAAVMPTVIEELERLVGIASVAFPGYPSEPVEKMAEETLRLFREVGFDNAQLMDVPSGYPPIYAELQGPPGSPVVMLYAHYDVQPAPVEQGWTSDPWTATTKEDGRIYGRGAADDKGGLAIHLGTMRLFDGNPPVTVRLIVEGMEETVSNLEAFVEAHPDLFEVDAFLVSDMGNLRVGAPALTTTLRGDVAAIVTVRTLEHPLHSGVFGGPAPDAMMALARLLSTLHDEAGDVAVAGVTRHEPPEAELSDEEFLASADLLPGVQLTGTGSAGARLWTSPSVSAIGIDMTSIAESSNVLVPEAAAKVSMRIVPGSDPVRELDALVAHLESHAPWGAQVEVERVKQAPPFAASTDGPAYAAAREALEGAYGSAPSEVGSGGSIPLLDTLRNAAPQAEFILWGPEDVASSRIHASNESVDPSEIERMVIAQALFMQLMAGR
jgi:acetylornithine deacetylase/succinyl-diaminopimelate desuccinylase-like protein